MLLMSVPRVVASVVGMTAVVATKVVIAQAVMKTVTTIMPVTIRTRDVSWARPVSVIASIQGDNSDCRNSLAASACVAFGMCLSGSKSTGGCNGQCHNRDLF